MDQHRLTGARDVKLAPAQRPFEPRPRCGERIEPAPHERDFRPREIGWRPSEEDKVVGGRLRRDPVDPRHLARQPLGQRPAMLVRQLLHHLRPKADSADLAHQREGTTDNRIVVAEADRLRNRHARRMRGLDEGELVPPGMARLDRGRRVLAQHEGAGGSRDLRLHRPVLLDAAALQRLQRRDADLLPKQAGDPAREPRRRLRPHQTPQLQKASPSFW